MVKNAKNLTKGTPWRLILSFALPVLFSLLLQQFYNTVDAVIVSNFDSETAFASIGVTTPLTMLFLALANGFSAGAGVIVSQLFGAEKTEEMRKNAATAILLLLGIGIVSSIMGILASRWIMVHLLAVSDNMLNMAVVYFRIIVAGFVFQFGYNIFSSLLRAVGDSSSSLIFLLIASVLNIVLDLLFVAVFQWSTAGAALATILAQTGSCVAAAVYMHRKYPAFRWKISEIRFDRRIAANVLHVGFPMALQQAIVSLGNFGIQRAVNSYGDAMTASFAAGQRIEPFLTAPIMSFQITMATYVGQNIGAGRMERVMTGVRQVILMSELCTIVVSSVVAAGAGLLTGLFNLEGLSSFYCLQHLRCTALVMLIIGAYFPLLGLFQGAGDGFAATVVGASVLTIRVVCTYTLCYLPVFGYRIVWWGQLFGFIGGFSITWIHFLHGKWKNKSAVQESSRSNESHGIIKNYNDGIKRNMGLKKS